MRRLRSAQVFGMADDAVKGNEDRAGCHELNRPFFWAVFQGVHVAEGGDVSIETNGLSSRLGAKWPPPGFS